MQKTWSTMKTFTFTAIAVVACANLAATFGPDQPLLRWTMAPDELLGSMRGLDADLRALRDAASPKGATRHCASEDPFLMFDARQQVWRYLEHQKLDDAVDPRDPHEPTGPM